MICINFLFEHVVIFICLLFLGVISGGFLKEQLSEVEDFNVVKGFLNLVISDSYYLDFFNSIKEKASFGYQTPASKDAVMVEYSSPNTNKPLHLGHIRNNLLGYAVAEILKAAGHKVYKTQIVNDRGIHICKSMLAWQRFGDGETPESSGLKGDHLVGKYYVAFDKAYKAEIVDLVDMVGCMMVSISHMRIWVLILTSSTMKATLTFWGKMWLKRVWKKEFSLKKKMEVFGLT